MSPTSSIEARLASQRSRVAGKRFEEAIARRAAMQDLLLVRHGHQARFLPGGRTIAVVSDLDFRVTDRQGLTAFFDAKSFDAASFTFSQLRPHQVARARRYAEFGLRAGFLVHLRQAHEVVWYNIAHHGLATGKGRIPPEVGLALGPVDGFQLARVLG